MSNFYTSSALLVGTAEAIDQIHRLVLEAERERPSESFAYACLPMACGLVGATYRSGKSRVSPQVGVVLGDEDKAIDALDVCIYLLDCVECDPSAICYYRGQLIHREDADPQQVWSAFRRHCNKLGVNAEALCKAT